MAELLQGQVNAAAAASDESRRAAELAVEVARLMPRLPLRPAPPPAPRLIWLSGLCQQLDGRYSLLGSGGGGGTGPRYQRVGRLGRFELAEPLPTDEAGSIWFEPRPGGGASSPGTQTKYAHPSYFV